jgi:hypothetical protein
MTLSNNNMTMPEKYLEVSDKHIKMTETKL